MPYIFWFSTMHIDNINQSKTFNQSILLSLSFMLIYIYIYIYNLTWSPWHNNSRAFIFSTKHNCHSLTWICTKSCLISHISLLRSLLNFSSIGLFLEAIILDLCFWFLSTYMLFQVQVCLWLKMKKYLIWLGLHSIAILKFLSLP